MGAEASAGIRSQLVMVKSQNTGELPNCVVALSPEANGWYSAYHMGWRTYLHPAFIAQLLELTHGK